MSSGFIILVCLAIVAGCGVLRAGTGIVRKRRATGVCNCSYHTNLNRYPVRGSALAPGDSKLNGSIKAKSRSLVLGSGRPFIVLALVVVMLAGCSAGHIKGKIYDPNGRMIADVDAQWCAVFRDIKIDPNGVSGTTSASADNFFSGLFGFLFGWLAG